MNNKTLKFLKNFSYTLSSNLISLIISTLVTIVIPKLIGIEEYGYWQLYLFYSSYVGFLHFGWSDGIYLRYGGKVYNELNKILFFSQFYMLVIFQAIIAAIIFVFSFLFKIDNNRIFILQMIAINLLIMNSKSVLLFILQGTNKIKEYAKITIIDRLFYCILIITFLLIGIKEYKLMIISDLIGKFISLLYAMYCCKDIVFQKLSTFYFSLSEAINNIRVGINLMFANIASMLIIGFVRFGIERTWDVTTFGKISLTLSISNFLMIFINAVGLVMFPILRRTDEKKLPSIYGTMRDFLMLVLFGVLTIYYPFKAVLSEWLPKYADSLKYMAILFPMCVYEAKMSLLINTYLKTIREEKLILVFNLITLFISFVVTFITTFVMKNLDLAVMSIVVLLAFKCILSEAYLSKILGISVIKDIVLELIMSVVFIISGWYLNSWMTVTVYGLAYIIYLFIKQKEIKKTIQNINILIKI